MRYLSYGHKYPDYGFYGERFNMKINKVPESRTKVPQLRVLPCNDFIIGKNVFPLYCKQGIYIIERKVFIEYGPYCGYNKG